MSDEIYVFTSTGSDSLCDAKEAEYVGGPPDRPHPYCQCKIDEKRRPRGCVTIELELAGVEADEPEPAQPDDVPVPTPGPRDPNDPKIEIDELPPGFEVQPPADWQDFQACCTFTYRITCRSGYSESGEIPVCAPPVGGLETYNDWERIYCPFMLEYAEEYAWLIAEAIADAVEARDECHCGMSA